MRMRGRGFGIDWTPLNCDVWADPKCISIDTADRLLIIRDVSFGLFGKSIFIGPRTKLPILPINSNSLYKNCI